MGLLDSITKSLFGGSDSKATSQSGFALLPPEIQRAFTDYGSQITGLFGGGGAQSMFTPMQQTGDETAAFDMIRRGLGTPEGFSSNLSMLMNPYDDYVINDINRQAQGANSLVNQAATQAGQQGSNRQFLGTNDVEQNRLNSIGQFRQSQYNNAVNQALGPLAGLQQQDIGNLFNIGQFDRNLDTQTRQSPFAALQAYGQLLGALPQTGGSTSTSTSSSQNGIIPGLFG